MFSFSENSKGSISSFSSIAFFCSFSFIGVASLIEESIDREVVVLSISFFEY
jgi:hypothetical protein